MGWDGIRSDGVVSEEKGKDKNVICRGPSDDSDYERAVLHCHDTTVMWRTQVQVM
jgi:hypothetical protein